MIKLSLPDGSVKEYKESVSALKVIEDISKSLLRDAVAIKLDDEILDVRTNLTKSGSFKVLTKKDKESLSIMRHSVAHIFAQALLRKFPEAKITIGPPIENGFYYDFDLNKELTEDELRIIEEEMKKIVKEDLPIEVVYKTKEEALQFFKNNKYKQELINDILNKQLKEDEEEENALENNKLKFYKQGEFEDLCRGPHLQRTGQVGIFKLDKITRAYWRGDVKNKQLYRIYGFVFWKDKELKDYLNFLEEAKKRDHRIIGKRLDLFSISDYAPGMPFFHNRGMIIWNELERFWYELHKKENYEIIKTPIMLNKELWQISGHWDYYKENMYISKVDNEEYAIKPMNCPGGILVYKNKIHSYKELPIHSGEIGLVHRHELSGTLSGLFRVRCFHQDDAHIFMREDQIEDEILGVLNLVDKIYSVFNLDYHLELSTRPEKSIGTDEIWEKAENGLKRALERFGKGYKINLGDGAFYGPKIDVHLKDAIGRTHQCGTIQLDMNLPERFKLYYINEKDERVRPVMVHRVIYGSFERFLGILIEHFNGKFPLWLSPVQIKIINVSDRHTSYCENIKQRLEELNFRVEVNYDPETISKKIAMAIEYDSPNYIIIVGDKDIENNTISVRTRKMINGRNEQYSITLEDFIKEITEERDKKLIKN